MPEPPRPTPTIEHIADRWEDHKRHLENKEIAGFIKEQLSQHPLEKQLSFVVLRRIAQDPVAELPPATGEVIRQDLEQIFEELLNNEQE